MIPDVGLPFRENEGQSQFYFGEYCDLLGGARWEHVLETWRSAGLSEERERILHSISKRFSSSSQFLFSDHQDKRFPLEVLWLKWKLFSDLCRAVYLFHKNKQMPHLSIQPNHVRLTIPSPVSASFPARWAYSLELDDVLVATQFRHNTMPSDLLVRLCSPPGGDENIFDAPVILDKPLGYEVAGTALIRSIEQVRGDDSQAVCGVIELHFLSDVIRPMEFKENDVFSVTLHLDDEARTTVQVWASMKGALEKGILLQGVCEPLSPHKWERFEEIHRSIFSQSKMNIFKSYNASCDLYSLGMMFFRMFLVNSVQDLSIVDQSVRHLAIGLAPMVQGLGPDDHRIMTKRFEERFQEYGAVFSRKSVLYSPEREEVLELRASDDLWFELLILAFRLVTIIPQFSFASDHGKATHHLMEIVLVSVDRLSKRIKMALFGSEPCAREIREACSQLRKEMVIGAISKDAI